MRPISGSSSSIPEACTTAARHFARATSSVSELSMFAALRIAVATGNHGLVSP